MSLRTLVAFAQENFGALAESTMDVDMVDQVPSVVIDPGTSAGSPARPRLPAWVSQRTENQELPDGAEHPWTIDGPIDSQQPPPNVDALGADALAFYAPFHFYRKGWGVFIRMSGVVYLAEVLKGATLNQGDEPYLDLAESFLAEHEWHHAATEIACTRVELTARQPLYRRYFAFPQAAQLEEALANAQATTWTLDKDGPAKARAEQWMRRQGPGYRDYATFLPSRSFSRGLDHAIRFMTAVLSGPAPQADSSLHTFHYRGTLSYRSMPCTRVNDLGAIGVSVLRPFPKAHGVQVFVHSNDHPPPHVHVKTLSGEKWVRYSWPDLAPLQEPLSGPAEKGLKEYVKAHGARINARIQAIYGQRL